jgi:hypothetical protein
MRLPKTILFLFAAGLLASSPGCEPQVQSDDLGEVIFDFSRTPRLQRLYPIKELPNPDSQLMAPPK